MSASVPDDSLDKRIEARKVRILAGGGFDGDLWRTSIRMGLAYARDGRIPFDAIAEDLRAWKTLHERHGWEEPP